jgi:hypothetical protein
MKKIIPLIVIITTTVHPVEAEDWETRIGIQAGACEAAGNIQMCETGSPKWHAYATTSYRLIGSWYATATAEHYSQSDGKADLSGDTANQTGVFNYYGVGVEWRW